MRRSEMRQSPPLIPTQIVTWVDQAGDVLARAREDDGDEDMNLALRPALLARLERFGLAITGQPLLELKPERT